MQRTIRVAAVLVAVLACGGIARAQQVADSTYAPPIPHPAHAIGTGPRVAIDGAHHNFHTVDGRYAPFAALLRRDGYRVRGFTALFTAESLRGTDVLVIANALHEKNEQSWTRPILSAFAPEEIAAVHAWVDSGGALFLIADHMPMAGAAADLARSFGVVYSDGFALAREDDGDPMEFTPGAGLEPSAVTRGRAAEDSVTKVVAFTGSAFTAPEGTIPVLTFGKGCISLVPETAWKFTDKTPKIPIEGWRQGALMQVGKGRVAVFGEAAMFSAQLGGPAKQPTGMNHPRAAQNHRFLLNVMHWLAS